MGLLVFPFFQGEVSLKFFFLGLVLVYFSSNFVFEFLYNFFVLLIFLCDDFVFLHFLLQVLFEFRVLPFQFSLVIDVLSDVLEHPADPFVFVIEYFLFDFHFVDFGVFDGFLDFDAFGLEILDFLFGLPDHLLEILDYVILFLSYINEYVADLGCVEVQPALALLARCLLCALQVLPHPALLFFQDGNFGLETHVFLSELVDALLELQGLRVESFLVLVDLLGQDPREVVASQVRFHEYYLLPAQIFVGNVVLTHLIGIGLSPISSHPCLG